MESLTNETVKTLIEESGEMWEAVRDRVNSPVLLQVPDQPAGYVYELSVPAGEKHPFWRVSERELSPEEDMNRQSFISDAYSSGTLLPTDGSSYFRVRAYVFNGRRDSQWDISVDRVNIEIINSEPISSVSQRDK
jgi:hypothetical protein